MGVSDNSAYHCKQTADKVFVYLFSSFVINVRYKARNGHPKDEADNDNRSHNIILEKFENWIYIKIIYEIPNSFHNILHCAFTLTLKTKEIIFHSVIKCLFIVYEFFNCSGGKNMVKCWEKNKKVTKKKLFACSLWN